MLLVNQQELPANTTDKNHPLYPYVKEYHALLDRLKQDCPRGVVKLSRIGWPKTNNGLLEPTPTLSIPLSAAVDGENGTAHWAYCQGAPIILPNGLRDIPERRMSISEQLTIDLKKQPDLAVFLIYKSPFFGKEYRIEDPEAEAYSKAMERSREIELSDTIWKGLAAESRLRMVATAWGVPNASELNDTVLRDYLEKKILNLEKDKRKHPTDPSYKGISEFLQDIKVDDELRVRAVVAKAIEDKVIKYNKQTGKYFIKDRFLILIPTTHIDRHVDYMTGFYSNPMNRGEFIDFLKEVGDADFVENMDKKGVTWLAGLFSIDTKDKADSLLKEEIKAALGV